MVCGAERPSPEAPPPPPAGERRLQIPRHSSPWDVGSVSPPLQSGLASVTYCPVRQTWPRSLWLGLSEP